MGLEPDLAADYQDAPTSRPTVYTGPGWNLAQRIAFRFALAYLILYILPFPIAALQRDALDLQLILSDGTPPDPENPSPVFKYFLQPVGKYVTGPYREFWDEVVLRTGAKVFGVEIKYRPMGSGDTTWNYVQLFVYAVLAAGVALLWTLAARPRRRRAINHRGTEKTEDNSQDRRPIRPFVFRPVFLSFSVPLCLCD